LLSSRRRQPRRIAQQPDRNKWIESAWVKRCGVCMRRWEASEVQMEDGIEKCPACIDHRTEEWKAETAARDAAQAASWEAMPQVSQAPLVRVFPGTIREITDSSSNAVYQSSPLALVRGVARTILLLGRNFSSADTITGAAGLTISVSARTETLTTLSLTAGLSMSAGSYGLTFNDIEYRNILSVR
jgi:hypothetical protein